MIVDMSNLDADGQEFTGEEPQEVLDLADDPDVKPIGPIRYSIRVSDAGVSLVAHGVLKADLTAICARCAESFKLTVCEPSFSVVREILNKDEAIDLTPDIRESIILAFPTNPLCAPDCKGLCSRCGTNLNKRQCGCANSAKDERWSVLKDLKI
ncbi:MAG: DUF177 domain-containing protein [bacterium]